MLARIQVTGQKCLAAVKSEIDKVGVHEHKLQAWGNPDICVELTEKLFFSNVMASITSTQKLYNTETQQL